MMQAAAFLAETQALDAILAPLDEAEFDSPTGFKAWTPNHILGHLHFWNRAALLALTDEPAFLALVGELMGELERGETLRAFEDRWLDGRSGHELRAEWLELAGTTAAGYGEADPARRVKWAGPDMGARSAITARQMETWAHGQAVFDVLGRRRQEHDRIRNIAELGVRSFAWSFANRGLPVPEAVPQLRLLAPSGTCWLWHEECETDLIEGTATDFCRVVTQVRNVADTDLELTGDTARQWMAQAQCFAGPPEPPPAPGTRYRKRT